MFNTDLAPNVEPPVETSKKYLEVILSAGTAEVMLQGDKYVVLRVESDEMIRKVVLLKELEFAKDATGVKVPSQSMIDFSLDTPVAAGDYLEAILGWGMAELAFTNEQYVINRAGNETMKQNIGKLVELGLVNTVPAE